MLQLDKTSVRPYLEYFVQFGSLHYQQEVDAFGETAKKVVQDVSWSGGVVG